MTKEAVGSIWNMSADLGNGRQVAVSWNMPEGATTEMKNQSVDENRSVLDRQQAKSAARGLEEEVERLAGQKKTVIDTIGKIDNKMDAKGGGSAAERSQREAAIQNLEMLTTNIESKNKLLQKLINEAK